MATSRLTRWLLWLSVIVLVLAIAIFTGFHFATKTLKSEVVKALGPHGEIGEIRVGLKAVEVIGLRIKGGKGWPAGEELSAKRVVIEPDLAALLDRNIRISAIHIEDAYLSLLRQRDGKLVLLPSLLGAAAQAAKEAEKKDDPANKLPQIQIGNVTLSRASVDFFDASVRRPPLKLRLEDTNASIGTLLLPDLTGRTPIELDAIVKGVRRDGKLQVKGHVEIASKDSDLKATLRNVDLLAFQPYLIKAAETGVKKGTLDLNLHSTVKANRLRAPGTVTLADLELSSGSTFMGMPRDTVVAMMKDKSGRITVDFTLDGNINDPRFSLNDTFSTRIGTSVAGALGISIESLAKGLGSVGGGAAKGVGEAIGKLFGK